MQRVFKIQMELNTIRGIYTGEVMEVTEQQYLNIIEMSKSYYKQGFEMYLEDGSFVVVSPEVVSSSVLTIKRID